MVNTDRDSVSINNDIVSAGSAFATVNNTSANDKRGFVNTDRQSQCYAIGIINEIICENLYLQHLELLAHSKTSKKLILI